MCCSALWDTPLRLLPQPPPLPPSIPFFPSTFLLSQCASNRVEMGTSLSLYVHTHTYTFLLCSGPYRTEVVKLMGAFWIDDTQRATLCWVTLLGSRPLPRLVLSWSWERSSGFSWKKRDEFWVPGWWRSWQRKEGVWGGIPEAQKNLPSIISSHS